MKYTIEVTQEDIDLGVPHNSDRCPVAISLSRTLGKPACVGATSMGVDGIPWIKIPERLARIIEDYDEGIKPEPFCFEIDL